MGAPERPSSGQCSRASPQRCPGDGQAQWLTPSSTAPCFAEVWEHHVSDNPPCIGTIPLSDPETRGFYEGRQHGPLAARVRKSPATAFSGVYRWKGPCTLPSQHETL